MSAELPKGWIDTVFSELFDYKGGSQPPKSTFSNTPLPGYVRLLQIRDFESDKYPAYIKDSTRWPKCEENDIMIGRYGASVGRILTGKAGAYNVALVRMIFSQSYINRDWVLYLLKEHKFQTFLSTLSRSAQDGFNKNDLERLSIWLPPLPEQTRIVKKIEALQSRSKKAREALEKIPNLIEKFRQSVLAAAFRGDLTKEWREKNKGKIEPASELLKRFGKDIQRRKAARSSVAQAQAEQSKLEGLPESWLCCCMGEVSTLQPGYAFKSKEFTKHGVRLLRGTNIAPGTTRWEEPVFLPLERISEFDAYSLSAGDIVIAMDRPIVSSGIKVARIKSSDLPCLLLQRVGRLQLTKALLPEYVYWFLFGSTFRSHIGGQATGTQLPHISSNDVESVYIPLPPIEEQQQIVKQLVEYFGKMSITEIQIVDASRTITLLDQSILAKAFRGELVEQDPNDEPASVLLEKIRKEREEAAEKKKGEKGLKVKAVGKSDPNKIKAQKSKMRKSANDLDEVRLER
jgi:type I restriction enzyme S subunit